jgi:hypothetical protein
MLQEWQKAQKGQHCQGLMGPCTECVLSPVPGHGWAEKLCTSWKKPCITKFLDSLPAEVTYKDITEVFDGRYRDHQLAAAYCSQLKTWTQMISMSLKEFTTTIKQSAHCAFVGVLKYFIWKDTTHPFIDGTRD